MKIEDLLRDPYWIIDILPEQVPANSAGQYFAIEEYFMREEQASGMRRKFARGMDRVPLTHSSKGSVLTGEVKKHMLRLPIRCS